jgi:hypothetical protein
MPPPRRLSVAGATGGGDVGAFVVVDAGAVVGAFVAVDAGVVVVDAGGVLPAFAAPAAPLHHTATKLPAPPSVQRRVSPFSSSAF